MLEKFSNGISQSESEIPVIRFFDVDTFLDYVGNIELSQDDNWNAYTRLFRRLDDMVVKLYIKNPEQSQKNIETVRTIYSSKILHDISNLVMPLALVEFDNKVVGYTMRYVEGECLSDALQDSGISHKQKLNWFSQMAQVICNMPTDVHIADLHGKNVIIHPNGMAYLIDIDGFEVDKLELNYGSSCTDIDEVVPSKYYNSNNVIKLDYNNDVWCWFRLLFQYLLNGTEWLSLSRDCRRDYLLFLIQQGVNQRFVDAAGLLLDEMPNYLSPDILDDFPPDFETTSYNTFLNTTLWGEKEQIEENWLGQFTV